MSSPPLVDPAVLFAGPDAPSEEDLYKCVHCGFCLQACPTYVQTGLETESPRGRIALMKAVNEGRIGMTPTVFQHWDLCIQCRACEVVCPSGVPYGKLIEATMAQVETHRRTGALTRFASDLLLRRILPYQGRLGLLVGSGRMYQRLGLQFALRKTGVLRLLSRRLAGLERSTPRISGGSFKAQGQVIPAEGERRARVALLSGCVMPLVHGPQMDAVTRVLARNGCEVVVTADQSCCGAIHSHVGDLEMAREMARRNIDAFLDSGVDAVIVASAGCSARMKEYGDLLKNDDYADRAEQLGAMVKDVHEFLVDLPVIAPGGRLDAKVTYQDPCHLSHAQRITEAPRILLNSIPGLDFVEMADSTRCCGAGGTYSITQREFSLKLLDSKMAAANETGADVLAVANPGCQIQLANGVDRSQSGMQVRYVAELLDEAYQRESG
jgi:glycolate oxidase iron-sulfur subunit